MDSCGYIEWYNRQSTWLRAALGPLIFVVIIVHGPVMMLLLILIGPPYLIVASFLDWLNRRRFWRKLKERGQFARWADVNLQLSNQRGTLLIEVTEKGELQSWWINQSRREIDPEGLLPTWQQIEDGYDMWSKDAFDAAERSSFDERLARCQFTAQALAPCWSRVAELDIAVRRESVVALPYWYGSLTSRVRKRLKDESIR